MAAHPNSMKSEHDGPHHQPASHDTGPAATLHLPPCEGYDIDAEAAPANGAPTEEEEVYLEDLTVAELKAELDSLGVKYPSTAHKADLVDLLAAQE